LHGYIVVGLMCGLRPGELSGLLWDDVDLDRDPPTLSVSGSMKRRPDATLYRGEVKRSKNGKRTVALPPSAVEALRRQRKEQDVEREAAGNLWADHGLIFASEGGSPLDPSNVRRSFRRIAQKAGIDANFPYLLRHTAVSLMLDAGATIDEAADLLGDDPRTLYAHYRHKVRPVAEAAMRMEAVLRGSPCFGEEPSASSATSKSKAERSSPTT
jgi:integrase